MGVGLAAWTLVWSSPSHTSIVWLEFDHTNALFGISTLIPTKSSKKGEINKEAKALIFTNPEMGPSFLREFTCLHFSKVGR